MQIRFFWSVYWAYQSIWLHSHSRKQMTCHCRVLLSLSDFIFLLTIFLLCLYQKNSFYIHSLISSPCSTSKQNFSDSAFLRNWHFEKGLWVKERNGNPINFLWAFNHFMISDLKILGIRSHNFQIRTGITFWQILYAYTCDI